MPTRVLMATTSFPSDAGDWKGRFVYDLAGGLANHREVSLAIWGPPGDLPGGVSTANSQQDSSFLERMSSAGGIAHLLRQRPTRGLIYAAGLLSRLRKAAQRSKAELYHVNWLQLALGLPEDARPAYINVLGSDYGLLRVLGMKSLLRLAFARRPTVLAPNAEWMAPRLETFFGDLAEIRPNPFGVRADWFNIERIEPTTRQWLVVSRITRKKLGDLLEWGAGLFGEQRPIVLLGPMQESINLPPWIHYAGTTNPAELLERWFPGAAGLLTLSRHDEGRPQVMIEGMAAGLPVIASRIPAHEDLIRHGETGWLVDSKDGLSVALIQAENLNLAAEVGGNARHWIRDRLGTWDDYASRCIANYEQLLESRTSHAP
jgi:glycosyltransferase involved in cell wall biosynthesis